MASNNTILYVGLGGMALYLLLSSKKASQAYTPDQGQGTSVTVQNPNTSNVTTDVKGNTVIHQSITPQKAKSIASELADELGAPFFSDDAAIWNLLKNLNQADFLAVSDAFGVMTADPIFSGSSKFLGTDLDLAQWINKEVTEPEITKIRNKFPAVF